MIPFGGVLTGKQSISDLIKGVFNITEDWKSSVSDQIIIIIIKNIYFIIIINYYTLYRFHR